MRLTQLTMAMGLVATLAACGDGGSDPVNLAINSATGTSSIGSASASSVDSQGDAQCFTGSPSAAFSANSTSHVVYNSHFGDGMEQGGVVVDTHKAVVAADKIALSGNYCVKDMQGDSSYTIGRWRTGVVTSDITNPVSTSDLGASASGAMLYYAYNKPSAIIKSEDTKQIACSNLYSTQAYLVSGSSATPFVTLKITDGHIALNPNGNIDVEFTASVTSLSDVSDKTYATTIVWLPNNYAYSGLTTLGYKNVNGRSMGIGALDVGVGTGDNVNIGGYYSFADQNGAQYTAAVSMTCQNS